MMTRKIKLILICLLFSFILNGCQKQVDDVKNSTVNVSTNKTDTDEEASNSMEDINNRLIKILNESGEEENIIDLLKEELDKMIEEGLITKYRVGEDGLIILTFPDGTESGVMTKKFDSDRD